MAEGKESFLMYRDWIHTIEKLSDDQAGKLMKHLFRYVNDLDPEMENTLLDIVFEPMKQSLKRDLKKYKKIVERNQINGSLGGRPPKPKKPSGLIGNPKNPSEPKKPDSDSDSDSVSTNVDNKAMPLDFSKNKDLMMEIVNNQSEHATWIETAYRTFKLEKKRLGQALTAFNDSLVLTDKVHGAMKEYKQHFFNWMNTQEAKGKLESIKR